MKGSTMLWLVIGILAIAAFYPFIAGDTISENYKITEARKRATACLESNINRAYPHSTRLDVAASDCVADGYCSFNVTARGEDGLLIHAMIDPKAGKVFLEKNSKPIALESETAFDVFGKDVDRIDRGVSACFRLSIKELIKRELNEHRR